MFRAHDAARDRPVAVKQFTLDLPPERVHQLVAELERIIAADLTHPALATPLAAGIHGVTAYLVHEYVAADSLDLVIREYGAAPAVDALRVAAQLAGALDFAAAVHMSHGALHPRDVLLASDDTRLTGIGITQALERIGVQAPVRRPYTPPERIAGGEWDRRADVFSLAMLTHELLWARRVSGLGARAVESMTAIPGADLDALRVAFARALAEDPSSRFETALEFAEALRRAFSSHQSPVVSPQSAVVSPQSPAGSPRPPVDSQQSPVGRQKTPVVNRKSPVDSQQPPVGSRESVIASPPSKPRAATPDRQPPTPSRQPVPDNRRQTTDDRPATDDRQPTTDPRLPLLDTEPEVDLPIVAADAVEDGRYRDVEVAPAIVRRDAAVPDPGSRTYLDYVRGEPERIDLEIEETPVAEPVAEPVVMRAAPLEAPPAPDRPSSMVPLILALAVGLTMGFAAGYGVGTRQRPAAAAVAPAETPTVPAGQEFTETAVASPPPAPVPAPAAPPAPEVESPKPEAGGRLLVRTTPAGALVFVDGQEHGTTPVAVRDLATGGHRVRVVRDGYVAAERRVVISPSRPAQSLTIALERSGTAAARGAQPAPAPPPAAPGTPGRFTGALMVVSRPPGAVVFLDGKDVGTTPLTLPSVPAGSHAIRLEHEGYRRWSSSVRVVASEQNRITASLER